MKLPLYGRTKTTSPPSFTGPTRATPKIELEQMRERILAGLFLAATIGGVTILLQNLSALITQAQWGIIAVAGLTCLAMLYLEFDRRIPYPLRSMIFLAVVYAAGVLLLAVEGMDGGGLLILAFFPVLAVVLTGLRGGIAGMMLSIAALAITGVVINSRVIETEATVDFDLAVWVTTSIYASVLGLMATISAGLLVQSLEARSMEHKSLIDALEAERLHMEMRMQQRSRDLERRLVQIRTAAEVSRSISSVLEVDLLLPKVCELIQNRFGLYYAGVFLIEKEEAGSEASPDDENPNDYAVLAFGTGDAGQKMLAEGHRLAVGGESMIGWSTASRKARIALDVGKEPVRFDNPHLPLTRSELALPIISQHHVLGALTIQSEKPSAFDQDDILVFQGIADSLAIAIDNARLFNEARTNVEEVKTLHRQYLRQSWTDVMAARNMLSFTYEASGEPADESPGEHDEEVSTPGKLRTLDTPIKLRDQVIGKLSIEAKARADFGNGSEEWTAEERALIESVTNQAALALENARLLEETQRWVEQERVAANISGKVWASTDITTILRTALQELGSSLRASEGMIQLSTDETEEE
jgi:GAF domain-containing protein